MSEPNVTLNLTKAEAIVLITFLMRYRDKDCLAVEHEAEQQLLWDLCCVVETKLPELFDPRWNELLDQARSTVLDGNEMQE